MSSGFAALDWYETPLYYDIVFAADDAPEGRFLEALHARYACASPASKRPRVLEPACGSGRMLLELARRGFEVTGFDGSASMLDFARARMRRAHERARLVHGRLEEFDVGANFDLAHCMVNTFKYRRVRICSVSRARCAPAACT